MVNSHLVAQIQSVVLVDKIQVALPNDEAVLLLDKVVAIVLAILTLPIAKGLHRLQARARIPTQTGKNLYVVKMKVILEGRLSTPLNGGPWPLRPHVPSRSEKTQASPPVDHPTTAARFEDGLKGQQQRFPITTPPCLSQPSLMCTSS